MPSKQLTLREQLRDPIFKKWFARNPQLPAGWRVYWQKEEGDAWKHKDFMLFTEGYKFLAKKINKVYDISLTHKLRQSRPPVVSKGGKREYYYPTIPDGCEQNHWCSFCRRITKFSYFKKHHNMPQYLDPTQLRCRICGVRYEFVRKYA